MSVESQLTSELGVDGLMIFMQWGKTDDCELAVCLTFLFPLKSNAQ